MAIGACKLGAVVIGCSTERSHRTCFIDRESPMSNVKLTTNHGDIVLQLNAEKPR